MYKAKVALIKCEDYELSSVYSAIKKGIDLLGGVSHFFKKGELILVKPNLLTSKELVCTHYSVFEAVIKLLKESQIEVTYGDSSGSNSINKILEKSKIQQVAQKYNLKLADFETGKEIVSNKGIKTKKFHIVNSVFEVDGIISLPKMKTHQLTKITGAIKNQYGCILGFNKVRYHYQYSKVEKFCKMLIDINKIVRPRLFIMDGIHAMEGNGPSNGNLSKMNTIIISQDPVAVDATFCRLININPEYILTNKFGKLARLGTYKKDDIEYLGDELSELININFDIIRKKKNNRSGKERFHFFAKYIYSRPVINPDNCTKCGKCTEVCPVPEKAVFFRTKKSFPEYKYKFCIKCYCCQEMCPSNAIDIKKPFLSKLFNW